MFAIVDQSGLVHQVAADRFDVSPPLTWVACDPSVQAGMLYANGEFSPAASGLSQETLSASLNAQFLLRARAGVPYDGRVFSITPDDRNEIAGILEGARNGEALFGVPWGGMNAPNLVDVEGGPYAIANLDELIVWTTALFATAAPLYTAWYTKKTEVRGLTTQAEIDSYDIEGGWPPTA